MKKSKRFRAIEELLDTSKTYALEEAVEVLGKCPAVKFDQSVEIAVKTGVDPQKSEQQVRGTVSLPHGTGKQMIVVVFAKGDKVQEALDAGADYAGNEELFAKVREGWTDFNAVIATPEMMREVGKLGKILGPRGLMPTPKAGSVTNEIAKAVREVKAGRIEFKTDKSGAINSLVGKLSFTKEQILENIMRFYKAILDAKPVTAKGQYIRSVALSSTMGPGIKLDVATLASGLGGGEA